LADDIVQFEIKQSVENLRHAKEIKRYISVLILIELAGALVV
jgi:hypothetical protein